MNITITKELHCGAFVRQGYKLLILAVKDTVHTAACNKFEVSTVDTK